MEPASGLTSFYDISFKALGHSRSMTIHCPLPGVGPETRAERNYEGGFLPC